MSYGTATIKYTNIHNVFYKFQNQVSTEELGEILHSDSLQLMAEAMVFPVEVVHFVYDENKQEAKARYND